MHRGSTGGALAVCAVLALAAACGTGTAANDDPSGSLAAGTAATTTTELVAATTPTTEPAATVPTAAPDPTIDWRSCGPQLECGRLEVPLDHDHPDLGTVSLAVVRRPADDPARRIGSLLVNPGGPGFGGTVLAESAEFIYGGELLERFDIVGWDPRGTGDSEPAIDCVDDYDPYFALDPSPDDAGERDALLTAARSFGQACAARSGELLPHASTEASARDMELLRRALGEDQISYFGFSYGSELGATWVSLYPGTVRAAVLDGAVDPAADAMGRALQQAAGFEVAFEAFLADCATDASCPLRRHGDPATVADALLERLDADPLEVEPARTLVTPGVAITAIVDTLYSNASWVLLAAALDAAVIGDGGPLLSLYDDYYQRRPEGTYGNELEAYFSTMCLDQGGPSEAGGLDDVLDRLEAVAPRLGEAWAVELQVCTTWPVPPARRVAVSGAGAPPVLVIGTTGDAATPLDGTRAMARALEGSRLVVADAGQHTGYGTSPCIDEVVERYLVDGTLPADGLSCST